MIIVMNDQQYQELECLIDIFSDMYFDDEEVQCFYFIKEILDGEFDTDNIPKGKKEKMQIQLYRGF